MARRRQVNDEAKPSKGKHETKLTRKCPRRAANVMCGSHQAWPVAHYLHEKVPGVPPGQTALLPNKFERKNAIVTNKSSSGSCRSCRTKMKVSCDHGKIKHLSNDHGKKTTRKAVVEVIKDDLQNVVCFPCTQQITIEFSSAQLANKQLPGRHSDVEQRTQSNAGPS